MEPNQGRCQFIRKSIQSTTNINSQIQPEIKQFQYNHILSEQKESFEKIALPQISSFISGINSTIFAYGQTASGKTYTMMGPENIVKNIIKEDTYALGNEVGIVPRIINELFVVLNQRIVEGYQYQLFCQYLEIYNESVYDLVYGNLQEKLKIREDPNFGVSVFPNCDIKIESQKELFEVLKKGLENCQISATQCNGRSSRSHTVFSLKIIQKHRENQDLTLYSKLNLVDLAGSEKVNKTQAQGATLMEAKKINQSLTTLGKCIMQLKKGPGHIPYRDSKLTFLLKDSLGGNTKTAFICTCSRLKSNEDETLSTLRFAQSLKQLKLVNKPRKNISKSSQELESLVKQLQDEIVSLTDKINNTQKQQQQEKKIEIQKIKIPQATLVRSSSNISIDEDDFSNISTPANKDDVDDLQKLLRFDTEISEICSTDIGETSTRNQKFDQPIQQCLSEMIQFSEILKEQKAILIQNSLRKDSNMTYFDNEDKKFVEIWQKIRQFQNQIIELMLDIEDSDLLLLMDQSEQLKKQFEENKNLLDLIKIQQYKGSQSTNNQTLMKLVELQKQYIQEEKQKKIKENSQILIDLKQMHFEFSLSCTNLQEDMSELSRYQMKQKEYKRRLRAQSSLLKFLYAQLENAEINLSILDAKKFQKAEFPIIES